MISRIETAKDYDVLNLPPGDASRCIDWDMVETTYEDGIISGVISTNLTYRTPELRNAPWFIEADMSKYVSYIIATLNHDRSLSGLLKPADRIHNLISNYKQQQRENGITLV